MSHFSLDRVLSDDHTPRERWQAFWQLYRITKKSEKHPSSGVLDCLIVLGFRDLLRVAEASPDLLTLRAPVVIRQQFLKTAKKRRLYGQHLEYWDEWRPMDVAACRQLASEGIEMTPDEVAATRKSAYTKIRQKAAEHGVDMPLDDTEMLRLMCEAMRGD